MIVQLNRDLDKLSHTRGVPKSLIDSLRTLGVDGAKNIHVLTQMTRPQLRRYVRLWQQAQAAIKRSIIGEQRKAARQAIKDFVDQAKTELTSRAQEVKQKYVDWWNDIYSSVSQDVAQGPAQNDVASTYMEVFAGPWLTSAKSQAKQEWGIPFSKDDLLKDIHQQADIVKNWKSDIDKLFVRLPGAADFINYLKSLGPDAASNIHILTTMTDSELQDYYQTWLQIKEPVQNAANDVLVPLKPADVLAAIQQTNKMFEMFRKNLHDAATGNTATLPSIMQMIMQNDPGIDPVFANTIAKKLATLPQSLIDYLKNQGPVEGGQLLDAILQMTPDQLEAYKAEWAKRGSDINSAATSEFGTEIAKWRKQGNDIAQALIDGVTDKQGELLKFFRNMFANMLANAKKETKSHSPSKVYMDLAGDIVDGMHLGLRKGAHLKVPMPGIGNTTKPMIGGSGNSTTGGQTVNNYFHQEVHAVHNESLEATLNRASFKLRNRPV